MKTIPVITDIQIDNDGECVVLILTKKPLVFDDAGSLTGCGDPETIELTIDPS